VKVRRFIPLLAAVVSAYAADRAPVFKLPDTQGSTFDLREHLGREAVLLDFWATYCAPCLAEMGVFQTLHAKYAAQGLTVAAISQDQPQTAARVRSLAKGRGLSFTVALDPDQEAYRLYGVSALPTAVLIDRRGRIVWRREGYQPGDEAALEARIRVVLAAPRPAPARASSGVTSGLLAAAPAGPDTAGRPASPAGLPQTTGKPAPSGAAGGPSDSSSISSPSKAPAATAATTPDAAVAPMTEAPAGAPDSSLAPGGAVSDASSPFSDVRLSGANFLRVNYGKETRSLKDDNGWLEDWFDFRASDGPLSYDARFRIHQFLREGAQGGPNLIRDPASRVVKQTFAYRGENAQARAGNLYGTVNRGLALRLFEDRQARIDKDMLGFWGGLEGEPIQGAGRAAISVLGGKTFERFTDLYSLDAEEDKLRDTYLQGVMGEWGPVPGLKAGAQYLEAFRSEWEARIGGGNLEWARGPASLYLAYMGLAGRNNFGYPGAYQGRALYGAASLNLGRLELGAEYKYYHDYDLGFTEPPNLLKYHTFRLMARDMLFPNNQHEEGVQMRGAWHFAPTAEYAIDFSGIESHPERNPALLIHHVALPYLDLDQTVQFPGPGGGNLLLDADWNNQRRFSEGSFEDVNAFSLGAQWDKPLRGPWHIQGELEAQRRDVDFLLPAPGDPVTGRLGEVGAFYLNEAPWRGVASATLARSSAWSFTVDYEVTTSALEADPYSWHYALPGIENGWMSAQLSLEPLPGHRIDLWYGQRRDRVVCSGGTCRIEPAFGGTEVIWTAHF
jgi:peroxiredoxin